METDTQKFLEAEKTASELAETLKKLHTEAESYHEAKGDLTAVREQLVQLIQSTADAVAGSNEVISILKEIGGPEIFNRLDEIKGKVTSLLREQTQKVTKLKIFVVLTFSISAVTVIVGAINFFLKESMVLSKIQFFTC